MQSVINATFLDFKSSHSNVTVTRKKQQQMRKQSSQLISQSGSLCWIFVCVCPVLNGPSSVFVLVSFQLCWCFWTPLCDIICKKLAFSLFEPLVHNKTSSFLSVREVVSLETWQEWRSPCGCMGSELRIPENKKLENERVLC